MNEVQNFANFHTCYLPYGFEFFHKGDPKHKLNYSWPESSEPLPSFLSLKDPQDNRAVSEAVFVQCPDQQGTQSDRHRHISDFGIFPVCQQAQGRRGQDAPGDEERQPQFCVLQHLLDIGH